MTPIFRPKKRNFEQLLMKLGLDRSIDIIATCEGDVSKCALHANEVLKINMVSIQINTTKTYQSYILFFNIMNNNK